MMLFLFVDVVSSCGEIFSATLIVVLTVCMMFETGTEVFKEIDQVSIPSLEFSPAASGTTAEVVPPPLFPFILLFFLLILLAYLAKAVVKDDTFILGSFYAIIMN